MKRLFQAAAAVSFGLVLGVLTAKLRLLIAEDSLSALTARALAFDASGELLRVLSGFGALAVSAFAMVGLGCVPKTRRSSEETGLDELVARDFREEQEEAREEDTETPDVLPRKVNGATNRPDQQSAADFVRDYVGKQLHSLEPGLTEFVDTGGLRGVEYATPLGPIDILAEDRAGDLVVVKIALNDNPAALCGKILAQIAWVRQHLADAREVRGILVARAVPEDLGYALLEIPSIQTCLYELQVNLRRQDSRQVTPNVTIPHDALGPATVSLVAAQ